MRAMTPAVLVVGFLGTAPSARPEACSSTTGRQISVNGSSVVRLPPDRVSFSVGVETRAASVAEAFRANNSKLNALLTALKAKGVQGREIQTSDLEIASRDDEGKKLAGFRVSNLVTVTREDPDTVSELLQAAVGAGANQAGSLRFFVSEPAKVQRRGLELAYQDARTKAETLAALSKRSLGEVVCVAETGPWGRGGFENSKLASLGYIQTPSVEIGTEQVSFAVGVIYELK